MGMDVGGSTPDWRQYLLAMRLEHSVISCAHNPRSHADNGGKVQSRVDLQPRQPIWVITVILK